MTEEPKRPIYLDKDGEPIPFFEPEETVTNKKSGYQFGIFSFLGFIAALILLASLTPLYSVLMRVTPVSWQEAILRPLYRSIPIYTEAHKYDEPIKIPGPLPVLGFDTGICFSFLSAPENTKLPKPVAEIIATAPKDKYEYKLESVTYTQNGGSEHIICQKFGRAYGSTPEIVNAVYIRPLEPFTAQITVWNSVKHLYDDYTSPIDPVRDLN